MAQLNTVPLFERIIATNEQVTRIPARELLHRILEGNKYTSEGSRKPAEFLDNACGSAVVLAELLQYRRNNPEAVEFTRLAIADIDQTMTSYAQKRARENNWEDLEVMTFDQQSVPLEDRSFTHITNNFGIFFSRDDHAALSETFRLLKPGGRAGFTSWSKITWFHTLAVPAITESIPEVAQYLPDPLSVFPSKDWHEPDAVRSKLRDVGFEDIVVTPYPFDLKVEHAQFAEATAFLVTALMKLAWPKDRYEKYHKMIEPAFLHYLKENFPGTCWEGKMEALVTTVKKPAIVECERP